MLDAVERIPPGRVLSYSEVAECCGAGVAAARAVGAVLARYGHEVPWHRVVAADGRLPARLRQRAVEALRAEGCPLLGDRVDMARARWTEAGPPHR